MKIKDIFILSADHTVEPVEKKTFNIYQCQHPKVVKLHVVLVYKSCVGPLQFFYEFFFSVPL